MCTHSSYKSQQARAWFKHWRRNSLADFCEVLGLDPEIAATLALAKADKSRRRPKKPRVELAYKRGNPA
jgi:hypothetical protein